ncbi:MAG: DMT family transporter [Verrucomicrobiales bacterium]|nr:DMT family transporter [Verrucomicrobiales bacterium]
MYLVLPLLAAMAFALGSVVFKRAFAEGAGVAHAVVVNNVFLALLFLPLLALEPKPVPWHLWYYPVLTGLAFVTGHLLNVLSLRWGDVSVATPLLGSKVVFIALILWAVVGRSPTVAQWWAAGLTTAGVLVMGMSDLRQGTRWGRTILLALGCAGAFAVTDVLIQTWASEFGVLSFLSLQFVALAAFSGLLLPFLGPGALRASRSAWKWTLFAAALSGVQAILITGTIGFWKNAAGVNTVYATRGIWSVLRVWGAGSWFRNRERHDVGHRGMAWRLAGAVLILVAVGLVMREGDSGVR